MKIIRYESLTNKDSPSDILEKNCHVFDKEEPEIPYIKVQITLLKHETRFSTNRPRPNFFKRFTKAVKESYKIFIKTINN